MARRVFGEFELDPASGDLWRGNSAQRLQDQPLRLLLCLLDHPGEVVDHEELRHRVWKDDIHVDFDDGLHAAAWRLRQALGDSAEHPRYIETVPRRGYRLVCPVAPSRESRPLLDDSFPMPVLPRAQEPLRAAARLGRTRKWRWILLPALGLLGVGSAALLRPQPSCVAIAPLHNGTGDPALDYLALGLSREVQEDLRETHGIRCLSAGAPAAAATPADLQVEWGLAREGDAYAVLVTLRSLEGERLADETFRAAPADLQRLHGRLAAFIASEIRERRR